MKPIGNVIALHSALLLYRRAMIMRQRECGPFFPVSRRGLAPEIYGLGWRRLASAGALRRMLFAGGFFTTHSMRLSSVAFKTAGSSTPKFATQMRAVLVCLRLPLMPLRTARFARGGNASPERLG